jgi:hypothetical protein
VGLIRARLPFTNCCRYSAILGPATECVIRPRVGMDFIGFTSPGVVSKFLLAQVHVFAPLALLAHGRSALYSEPDDFDILVENASILLLLLDISGICCTRTSQAVQEISTTDVKRGPNICPAATRGNVAVSSRAQLYQDSA